MHRVFQVPEILNLVLKFIAGSSEDYESPSIFLSVARTCKLFEEPALEHLWHTQSSLVPLLRCAPNAFEEKQNQEALDKIQNETRLDSNDVLRLLSERTIYGVKPLSPLERRRINKYSSKIKRFQCNHLGGPSIDLPSVVPILFDNNNDQHLFLNLRSLQWPIDHVEETDYFVLTRLIGPKLDNFNFPAPYGKHGTDISVIDTLRTQCPMLSNLSIGGAYTAALALALRDLFAASRMLRRVECSMTLDSSHLVPLSSLPNLQVLNIKIREGTIINKDLCSSVPSIFPSLTTVELESEDIRTLPSFLGLRHFNHLSSIKSSWFPSDDHMPPRLDDIREIFNAIAKHCSPAVLDSIVLDYQSRTKNTFSYAKALNSNEIKPLLSFPNMRVFKIEGNICINFNDSDIGIIAESWPKLQRLHLDPENGIWLPISLVTIYSLPILARNCPKLKAFGAKLDCRETFPPFPSDLPRVMSFMWGNDLPCPSHRYENKRGFHFRKLHVGNAGLNNPYHVASYLSDLFPNMTPQSIYAWENFEEEDSREADFYSPQWEIVNKMCSYFLEVRQQERTLITRSKTQYCDSHTGLSDSESETEDNL
ncbi:hypothetical protein ABKN59_007981 [Abortiporus biennis]